MISGDGFVSRGRVRLGRRLDVGLRQMLTGGILMFLFHPVFQDFVLASDVVFVLFKEFLPVLRRCFRVVLTGGTGLLRGRPRTGATTGTCRKIRFLTCRGHAGRNKPQCRCQTEGARCHGCSPLDVCSDSSAAANGPHDVNTQA